MKFKGKKEMHMFLKQKNIERRYSDSSLPTSIKEEM